MTLITNGPEQNSYVTLDEAQLIIMGLRASFMDGDEEFSLSDEAYLTEAAIDLEALWQWTGEPSTIDQELAWPRRYVAKPGWITPCEPGWSAAWNYDDAIRFKIDFLTPGVTAIPYLDNTVVPKAIKEAQVLIAILRKKGKNLVGDNQGDALGMQLDTGFKINYVNALRDAADIHKRLAAYGLFIGDPIMRTPNV